MEFIIVLGNSKREVRVNRLKKAVDYYNQIIKNNSEKSYDYQPSDHLRLILSGKGASVPNSSEAEDMYKTAISDFYVPSEICVIENKSNNTRENFIESLKILVEAGWFTPTGYCGKYTFTIVTSRFHAARSLVVGLEILSQYGDVKIIHTGEEFSSEVEHKENCLLVNYVKNVMLVTKSAEIQKNL